MGGSRDTDGGREVGVEVPRVDSDVFRDPFLIHLEVLFLRRSSDGGLHGNWTRSDTVTAPRPRGTLRPEKSLSGPC